MKSLYANTKVLDDKIGVRTRFTVYSSRGTKVESLHTNVCSSIEGSEEDAVIITGVSE